MHPHHSQSIQNVTEYFQRDPEVQALLLAGSIAHGFQSTTSDVDIMIFVSEESYQERFRTGRIHFFNTDLCTYEGGYVDGKYLSLHFVRQVLERGSEPARFAFEGSRVLFSRVPGFEEDVCRIAIFPRAEKDEHIRRFYAQFEAWRWYCGEALKQGNQYLLRTSVSKLILFGGRLILAHNEMLYPYHKWFLKVLERASDKPTGLMTCIEELTQSPTANNIEIFYENIKTFRTWSDQPQSWPAQFMLDSELNWLNGRTPVEDI
ncbi:MAG TPA: nucleotidyltransferase domain-containing protein [Anaerolineales bacterium]|nr:nucleotidyltransferase domain-containing protein [Anaerolineales bacterium]